MEPHRGTAAPERPPVRGRLAAGELPHAGELRHLRLDSVWPRSDQPRRTTDPRAFDDLVRSVRTRGVLQPIRVRPADDGYEIIAGERRWSAARAAGLDTIPALIVTAEDDDAFIDALVENVQREDLSLIDRAEAIARLRATLDLQSWEAVGDVLGLSRVHVHRLLNVAKLPPAMRDDERVAALTEKHVRALVRLRAEPVLQRRLWDRIHAERLSGQAALDAAADLLRHSTTTAGVRQMREVLRRTGTRLETLDAGDVESLRDELRALAEQITQLLGD